MNMDKFFTYTLHINTDNTKPRTMRTEGLYTQGMINSKTKNSCKTYLVIMAQTMNEKENRKQ